MRIAALIIVLLLARPARAESILFEHAVVHTVSGPVYTNGGVLVNDGKIAQVFDGNSSISVEANRIFDLKGSHLYPGMIAVDTCLGLTEIAAVRATEDRVEVGDYTPDVESWIAVNPDSELLPVARANGVAYFEPTPQGGVVAGQSGFDVIDGWTSEQMAVRKPVALHVFWPGLELDLRPRPSWHEPEKFKSPADQAKERRVKLKELTDFFAEARAYAQARDAAARGAAPRPEKIPAWEAMLPYVKGELPVIVHADDVRQIKSAVHWAVTNGFKMYVAGGRDAFMVAGLLASNKIPVIYENVFTLPVRDTESYDVHFTAPEVLHQAGVQVIFGVGLDTMDAENARNVPYAAAQAVAFGMPADEALKGLTLYPAQMLGVADRLGSIEPGKEATFFISSGDILDIRSVVQRMWISGKEVSLASRQTRLYDKYKNRPRPK